MYSRFLALLLAHIITRGGAGVMRLSLSSRSHPHRTRTVELLCAHAPVLLLDRRRLHLGVLLVALDLRALLAVLLLLLQQLRLVPQLGHLHDEGSELAEGSLVLRALGPCLGWLRLLLTRHVEVAVLGEEARSRGSHVIYHRLIPWHSNPFEALHLRQAWDDTSLTCPDLRLIVLGRLCAVACRQKRRDAGEDDLAKKSYVAFARPFDVPALHGLSCISLALRRQHHHFLGRHEDLDDVYAGGPRA
mmetsp:Transcript_40463/g.100447  ORF Transcript_40463/g.100447 Transcript_40463/m.100447 type:complete len:246 (-) Transcript_40463:21-758(-)